MKLKNDSIFNKIGQVVSLNLMLEKDINTINTFSGEDLLNIDKSIHNIRKSLKSISAILFLYEFQIDQTQYLGWKSDIKSLSKEFAVVREHFVYLQTFSNVEGELKDIEKSDLGEIRNQFESNYNQILLENIVSKETIRKGNEAIIKITEAIQNLHINSVLKLLKRRLLKSFRKSQKLYERLSLNSSSDEFHQFRKWCKRFYFQQVAFNQLGFKKTSKQNKKLYKLTEYLGKEHDLHLFYQYLSFHFAELSQLSQSLFMHKIKKLRRNVLMLYPKINY
jgi:CHAD domain-containing protein